MVCDASLVVVTETNFVTLFLSRQLLIWTICSERFGVRQPLRDVEGVGLACWLTNIVHVASIVTIRLSSTGFAVPLTPGPSFMFLGFFFFGMVTGSGRKWLGCADLSPPFAASIGAWTEAGLTELCSDLSNDLQSRREQEDIPLRHSEQTCPLPSGWSSEEASTPYAGEATLAMCDEKEKRLIFLAHRGNECFK